MAKGYIVKTASGKYGIYYWKDKFVNKKCPVVLLDDKGNEESVKTLCIPKTLNVIGFID